MFPFYSWTERCLLETTAMGESTMLPNNLSQKEDFPCDTLSKIASRIRMSVKVNMRDDESNWGGDVFPYV